MLAQVGSNQPVGKIETTSTVPEVLKQAETICKDCRVSSPMVCVQRCDVWRVKNEILRVRKITSEKAHGQRLLNGVKNPRRIKILDALCERPKTLNDLQRYLKREGFYHSRGTIKVAYIKLLIAAGLVQEESGRYKITFYGRKVQELLHQIARAAPLPIHSCCYEETIIKELMKRPRNFDELADFVPRKSLSRILMRLQKRGLLSERFWGEYIFYHKIDDRPKVKLSPTERRVFDIIPLEGISASQLSKKAKITKRRTYKYLRRLRDKKIVFALKKLQTYKLTAQGKEIGAFLKEIDKFVSSLAALVPQP